MLKTILTGRYYLGTVGTIVKTGKCGNVRQGSGILFFMLLIKMHRFQLTSVLPVVAQNGTTLLERH